MSLLRLCFICFVCKIKRSNVQTANEICIIKLIANHFQLMLILLISPNYHGAYFRDNPLLYEIIISPCITFNSHNYKRYTASHRIMPKVNIFPTLFGICLEFSTPHPTPPILLQYYTVRSQHCIDDVQHISFWHCLRILPQGHSSGRMPPSSPPNSNINMERHWWKI